jgi:HK97 family phage major capsid protein
VNKNKMLARIGETQTRRDEILALGDKATEADGAEFVALVIEAEKLQASVAMLERGDALSAATAKAQPLPAGIVVNGPVAEDAPYPLGDFLMDVHADAMKRETGHRFKLQNQKFKAAASGMNESAPSDGGFLVGTQQAGMLSQRAYNEGQVAALCQRVQISGPFNGLKYAAIDESSRADGSRSGGVLSYWKNEGNAATAKAPKFREDTMNLEKLIGLAYVTEELLQDSTALEGIIMAEFGKEFAFQLDDKVLNGTGAGQPLGILNAPALVSQAKETGQTAATISFDNIIKMYSRLWSGSNMASTRWVCNRECFPQLMSLSIKVGTAGYPLYIPGNSLTGAPNGTLLGIPVVFAEQALALGTAGDIYLADFGQYRIIEKAGIQAASSMHVLFTTDEMAYRFTMRVNGQPLWNKPVTPYKGTSSTISPFVALAVRS